MDYCKETGKITYKTKQEADLVIKSKKERRKGMRTKRFKNDIKYTCSYYCKYCGYWHLAGK